jgi:hypothetical protein
MMQVYRKHHPISPHLNTSSTRLFQSGSPGAHFPTLPTLPKPALNNMQLPAAGQPQLHDEPRKTANSGFILSHTTRLSQHCPTSQCASERGFVELISPSVGSSMTIDTIQPKKTRDMASNATFVIISRNGQVMFEHVFVALKYVNLYEP